MHVPKVADVPAGDELRSTLFLKNVGFVQEEMKGIKGRQKHKGFISLSTGQVLQSSWRDLLMPGLVGLTAVGLRGAWGDRVLSVSEEGCKLT